MIKLIACTWLQLDVTVLSYLLADADGNLPSDLVRYANIIDHTQYLMYTYILY